MAKTRAPRAQNGLLRWCAVGLLLAATLSLVLVYEKTQKTISVLVDGQSRDVRTHQRSVAGLVHELDLQIHPSDILLPSPDEPLADGDTVVVRHATRVIVQADGAQQQVLTHATTMEDLLRELGLALRPKDILLVEGRKAPATASLNVSLTPSATRWPGNDPIAITLASTAGRASAAGLSSRGSVPEYGPEPTLRLQVRRAVPLRLHEGASEALLWTTADTVGEALRQEGIPIYLGDQVQPSLSTVVRPDLNVYVERARPVTIVADGKTIRTRTQSRTVEQALAEEGIVLENKDYSQPEPISQIKPDMTVRVTRVREEIITEEEPIPYNTVWQPAPDLEIDERQIAQSGLDGVFKRRIHVVYEDGVETKRLLEREWVDQEPVTKIIAYGTKIVLHDAVTVDGPIQYWRKLRVYATWYNASHGWFPRSSPFYGMTRTGLYAAKGIVAVDPQVISLHTRMYVPGYGFAAAEDTGGLIKGMRIDLAFAEGDPTASSPGWTTIYLLPPVPPASQISWILPDYPR